MRYVYGFRNTAAFNARPGGDEHWYSTRASRDAALAARRADAIDHGLSRSAARGGIVPIRRHVDSETGAAWLRELMDGAAPVGISWDDGDDGDE